MPTLIEPYAAEGTTNSTFNGSSWASFTVRAMACRSNSPLERKRSTATPSTGLRMVRWVRLVVAREPEDLAQALRRHRRAVQQQTEKCGPGRQDPQTDTKITHQP